MMSRRILVGLVAGIATGLFFGDKARVLEWPARAFVQLLQVTVLPYIVTSLVSGIASGTPGQARRLASKGGIVLVLLWGIGLALAFLSPLALPPSKGGGFYATSVVQMDAPIDWLDLYIPSNPFRSLANNVVPAVVVFSILFGIALLGLPEKSRILGPLRLINDTLGRAGLLLVSLAPFGIFAIVGNAAGTLRFDEFERLQAYLLVWIGLSSILTLWILPGLITTLTGVPYRRILSVMWAPLITSFVTSNLFIVLPDVQERAKRLLGESQFPALDADGSVDVLIPTSFTFPNCAKLLSLTFVLFAGWFAGSPVEASQLPALAGAGMLSMFGSLNSAIPFLLDLVRLPADLFQLFVVASVVNSQFGSAAAAMHTLAVGMLGAHFMSGRTRVPAMRLAVFALTTAVIVGGFVAASRVLLATTLPDPETAGVMFDRLRVTGAWGRMAARTPADEAGTAPSEASPAGQRLDTILQRGSLRVCLSPDAAPWAFINGRGETVGFEMDMANALAVQLSVSLSPVTVPRVEKGPALARGDCDISIGRVTISEVPLMAFSRPLTEERWAFLTPDYRRSMFTSLDRLRELPSPKIAVFREREFMERLASILPNAVVTGVESIGEFIEAPEGRYDAMFTGFDRATAFSLMSPAFAAVVPTPDLGSVPMAFIVPKGEDALLNAANAVVDVGTANGLFTQKLDYWVRGTGRAAEREPRWSIGGTVLGWWRD